MFRLNAEDSLPEQGTMIVSVDRKVSEVLSGTETSSERNEDTKSTGRKQTYHEDCPEPPIEYMEHTVQIHIRLKEPPVCSHLFPSSMGFGDL
jgi:hypothetical protein